jgi:hypothetical protein
MSLERLPIFNNIYDSPKLHKIDFADCPEHIGNVVHNYLFSEVSLSLIYMYMLVCVLICRLYH